MSMIKIPGSEVTILKRFPLRLTRLCSSRRSLPPGLISARNDTRVTRSWREISTGKKNLSHEIDKNVLGGAPEKTGVALRGGYTLRVQTRVSQQLRTYIYRA